MATFVDGYNHTRCHTGIGLNTPPDVQYGLATARVRTPEQFASNTWQHCPPTHPGYTGKTAPPLPDYIHP